jgi:hypothetical protein
MPKSIDDFTDAELAKMVRESIYAKNARFGNEHNDCRFLIVLAVPYGPDDFPDDIEGSLGESLDAFARLLQDDDWNERSFQVYDHAASQHYYQATREECE